MEYQNMLQNSLLHIRIIIGNVTKTNKQPVLVILGLSETVNLSSICGGNNGLTQLFKLM
jgi:hypothetical protein